MSVLDIQYRMRKRGWTQRRLARKLKISEPYLSQVLHGHRKAVHIQKEIAKAAGMSLEAFRRLRAA